jgi:hypothetical protein
MVFHDLAVAYEDGQHPVQTCRHSYEQPVIRCPLRKKAQFTSLQYSTSSILKDAVYKLGASKGSTPNGRPGISEESNVTVLSICKNQKK